MRGLVEGVAYMHDLNIIHRDLKPENILVCESQKGKILKIADFGTSKFVKSGMLNTNYVSTRWYRAPECLLSSPHYGKSADIFALGCILAEFIALKPLFCGQSSLDQFYKYCEVLGSPTMEEWAEGHSLSLNGKIKIPFYKGTGIS